MPSRPPRIVIIGATSAIAEQCARLWAERGPIDATLVGRDMGRLERVAADLRVRSPGSTIATEVANLLESGSIARTAASLTVGGVPDIVLVAHGSLPDQAACQGDLDEARTAIEVNGTSPVLWAEAFAGPAFAAGRGTIAVIGSVAGDRGRRSNYAYGAAKGMVTRWMQGLQHRAVGTGVRPVLIKPGPTDTPMTAALKAQGRVRGLAPVEDVAAAIVRGIDRGAPVVYAPGKWALIMMVIRHLPRFVFDRMDI